MAGGIVQLHIPAAEENVQAVNMGEVEFLRLLQISEKRAAGADGVCAVLNACLVDIRETKLLTYAGSAGKILKQRGILLGHGVQLVPQKGEDGRALRGCRREKDFPGEKARKFVAHMLLPGARKCGAAELPCCKLTEGDSGSIPGEKDRTDIVAAFLGEHGALRHGTGGDNADDVPLYQPFGQRGILRLLADGDLVALRNQLCDIALGAVVGDAAHRGALFRVLHVPVAGGQGEVELAGGGDGVLVEHLIEIPEPEKEQAVGMLCLDLLILLFHRRELSHLCQPPARTAPGTPRKAPRCCRK